MNAAERLVKGLNSALAGIAGVVLVGMIALACVDIFLSLAWKPIRGTYELTGYFGALTTSFAMGYTQLRRGHIAVDILVDLYSSRGKRLAAFINGLVGTAFFGLLAWQMVLKADNLRTSGEVTETLRVIYYPFTFCVALGCAVLALTLVLEAVKALSGEPGEGTA